jgi:hypothetical protein
MFFNSWWHEPPNMKQSNILITLLVYQYCKNILITLLVYQYCKKNWKKNNTGTIFYTSIAITLILSYYEMSTNVGFVLLCAPECCRKLVYHSCPTDHATFFRLGSWVVGVMIHLSFLLMESLNRSQYNCKAGRDWREDGDPDVPVPPWCLHHEVTQHTHTPRQPRCSKSKIPI